MGRRALALALCFGVVSAGARAEALCSGQIVPRISTVADPRPQVRLEMDGVPRAVLLDTGSTFSTLFNDAPATERRYVASIGIDGAPGAMFSVSPNSFAPIGEKNGALFGTDILSRSIVVLTRSIAEFSPAPCDDQLKAAGFRRVDESGHFGGPPGSHASAPNVPILPLRIGDIEVPAQIDTGYGDSAYPFSVDINEAMRAALRAAGVSLTRIGGVTVSTCKGSERRDVFAAPGPLTLGAGGPLAQTSRYVLIPKSPNGCGGIAGKPEPQAQLSARFLELFEAVALDGPAAAIWVKPK